MHGNNFTTFFIVPKLTEEFFIAFIIHCTSSKFYFDYFSLKFFLFTYFIVFFFKERFHPVSLAVISIMYSAVMWDQLNGVNHVLCIVMPGDCLSPVFVVQWIQSYHVNSNILFCNWFSNQPPTFRLASIHVHMFYSTVGWERKQLNC